MKIDFKTCQMPIGRNRGKVVIKTQENFDKFFAHAQSQGFAQFKDDNGWNWVNQEGFDLTDKRYNWVGDFTKEGFALFKDDKGFDYINIFGFEFRGVEFTWGGITIEGEFEKNKKELLNMESKLLNDFFPKTSMKYFILTKVLT